MVKGVLCSLTASMLFGYLYYFSTLLLPLSGEDIFGFRILVTLPFILLAVWLFKQQYAFKMLLRRLWQKPWLILGIVADGAIMGVQMWLFLWAPANGSAMSTSLGYLLLPLVLVLTGRLVFKEQISKFKLVAVCIAAIGVLSNIWLTGGLSWESLVVSLGYALYFIIRKGLKIADFACFTLEMLSLLPIAIYLALQVDFIQIQQANPHIGYFLAILGLISGVAMIAYITASNLLPVNLLGLMGYAEPTFMLMVSFLLGESIQAESLPLFCCLLVAMLFLIADGIRHSKRKSRHSN